MPTDAAIVCHQNQNLIIRPGARVRGLLNLFGIVASIDCCNWIDYWNRARLASPSGWKRMLFIFGDAHGIARLYHLDSWYDLGAGLHEFGEPLETRGFHCGTPKFRFQYYTNSRTISICLWWLLDQLLDFSLGNETRWIHCFGIAAINQNWLVRWSSGFLMVTAFNPQVFSSMAASSTASERNISAFANVTLQNRFRAGYCWEAC